MIVEIMDLGGLGAGAKAEETLASRPGRFNLNGA
jgi:hypothetical protein